MEFVSLPFTRLMEIPIALLPVLNRWATNFFNWITDNSFIDWMNDLREDKPLVFWLSGIIWIPLMIVIGFYGICLSFSCAFIAVIGTMGLSVVFAMLCKIIYVFVLMTHK